MFISILIAGILAALNHHLCLPSVKNLNFTCIETADQLYALFQSTPEVRKTYERKDIALLLFHVHIDVAASQRNYSTSNPLESKCCQASNTQGNRCSLTAVYIRSIYEFFPPPLVLVFLIPTTTMKEYLKLGSTVLRGLNSIQEICWTPSRPFCPGKENIGDSINGFVIQVKCHDACPVRQSFTIVVKVNIYDGIL